MDRRFIALGAVMLLLVPAVTAGVVTAKPTAFDTNTTGNSVAAADAALVAAAAGAHVDAANAGLLHPAWFSEDPHALKAFLAAHYDPVGDRFAFEGATAPADAALAEAILAELRLAEDLFGNGEGPHADVLKHLFATGTLPEGWHVLDANGVPVDADGNPLVYEVDEEHEAEEAQGTTEADEAGRAEAPPAPAPEPASEPERVQTLDEAAPPADYRDGRVEAPGNYVEYGTTGDGIGVMSGHETSAHWHITDCPKCDSYLYAGSSPIRATFDLGNITPEDITDAIVDISAYDVDWGNTACPAGPERDAVLLNGNHVGYLTGADSSWSSSSFSLNPAWFVEGVNTLDVIIDATGTGCWAVEVDFFDVNLNHFQGPVVIESHDTDKGAYNFGETIAVETVVKTEEEGPYSARVEWNLVRPDGEIVSTKKQSVSLAQNAPQTVTTSFTLPNSGKDGKWTVVAIAYDKDGGKSSERSRLVSVGTDLIITDEDIALEVLETNDNSGLVKMKVTVDWELKTEVQDAQDYAVEIRIEGSGSSGLTERHDRSDAGGAQSLERTFNVKPGGKIIVTLDVGDAIKETREENNKAERSLCTPSVKSAAPEIEGWYFSGIRLDNDWTAEVEDVQEGCAPITKVIYQFGGESGAPTAEATGGGDWKATFDMGKMKEGVSQRVKVWAEDADGNRGEAWETTVRVFDLPSFVVWGIKAPDGVFSSSIEIHGKHVTYKFRIQATLWDSSKNVKGPEKSIKQLEGAWGATLKVYAGAEASTKNYALTITGGLAGEAKGGGISTGFDGSVSGKFENPGDGNGWRLVEVKIKVQRALLKFNVPVYNSGVLKVNMTIGFAPSGEFTFSESGTPKLFGTKMGFQGWTFQIEVEIGATATLGGDGVLSINGELTGTVTPKFQKPVPHFKEVTFGIKFRIYGEVWGWEKDLFQVTWQTTYHNFAMGDPQGAWTLPDRSWTTRPAYATFTAGAPGDATGGLAGALLGATVTPLGGGAGAARGDLVQNVYPRADPVAVAGPNGEVMLVFTHDDAAKARPASFDTYFLHFDGHAWSAPAPVAASDHAQFNPTVAWGPDGTALAAWVEFKDAALTEEDALPERADLTEIAYATWTADTGWSLPQRLTDNARLDVTPQVAADNAGGFIIAWQSADETTALTPSQADVPDDGPIELPARDLVVARVTPGVPALATPVMTAAHGLPLADVHRVTHAGNGNFLLAFAVDADADARTLDDVTLFAQAGTVPESLGRPMEVAVGGVRGVALDHAPDGRLVVAWREELAPDRETVRARDATVLRIPGQGLAVVQTAPVTLVPADTGHAALNAFRFLVDPVNGDRVVTWEAPVPGTDAQQVVSVVAPAGGFPEDVTPRVLPVTDADKTAWRSSVLLSRNAGGDARALVAVGLTVSEGATHLTAHARPLLANLVVHGARVADANPAPGAATTVATTVRNEGDVDAPSVSVALLDNGEEVARQVVSLPRGESADVAFAWTVPEADVAHTLTVTADGGPALVESLHEDNAASVTTVLPDLAVTRVADVTTPGTGFRVEGLLENHGVRAAPAGEARVTLEGTEDVLGLVPYPAVPAGGSVLVDVTPHLATLPADGARLVLAVRPVEDANASNDADAGYAASLPDLALADEDVQVGAWSGASTPVTLAVRNLGTRDVAGGTLRVLNGHPGTGGELVTTVPVPALAAGASVNVTVDVPTDVGAVKYWFQVVADGARDVNPVNDLVTRTFAYGGVADADVTEASLAFEEGGVRVTVFNRGNDSLPHAAFQLFNGEPTLDGPRYGKRFVTEVVTRVGRGGVLDVPPGGAGSTLVPYAELDLAQIPVNGSLSVWLDPHDVTLDADRSNHKGATPLLSVASPTHPDPATPTWDRTASFDFGTPAARTLEGVSWVVDASPDTVPDDVVDTTGTTLVVPDLADGTWWLHARGLVDGAWTDVAHYRVRVDARDATAPVTRVAVGAPALEVNGVTHVNADVPVELFAKDAAEGGVSGIALTEYAVDAGAWTPYDGAFTLTTPGAHVLRWRSVDRAGNVEDAQSLRVFVEAETDAPVTLITGVATVPGDARGFVPLGQLMRFVAEDPEPYWTLFASGVAGTEFRVDGGAWTPITSGFRLTTPGEHLVEWRSRDHAGNVEATRALTVVAEADVDAPVASLTGGRVLNGVRYATPDTTFGFTVEDTGEYVTISRSALLGVVYRVDGGGWKYYSRPITLPSVDGEHVIEFAAMDRVRNAQPVQRVTVVMDATAPEVAVTDPSTGEWVTGPVTFTGTVSDGAGSGVRSVTVHRDGAFLGVASRDGAAWSLTADAALWPAGNNRVTVRAVDALGNAFAEEVRVFVVSTNPFVEPDVSATNDRYRPDRLPQP